MKDLASYVRRPIAALGRRVLGTITGVSTSHPVIALTFDDGPHPQFTPMMLEVLKRHRARATFFMLGEYARKYPGIVKSVARDGHAIGNHSWDHPSFPVISSKERRRQIRTCGQALVPYGNRIFRPPFGHQTLRTRFDVLLLGYRVITWDVAADDWHDHDARRIADRVGQQAKPGSIILFHDALASVLEERHESREQTLEAVNMLLQNLGDRFRFVTVPELLRHGRPQRVNWQRQPQVNLLKQLRNPGGKSCREETSHE